MFHNLAILTDQQPEIAGEKMRSNWILTSSDVWHFPFAQWVIILFRCYSSLPTFYCLYICLLFFLLFCWFIIGLYLVWVDCTACVWWLAAKCSQAQSQFQRHYRRVTHISHLFLLAAFWDSCTCSPPTLFLHKKSLTCVFAWLSTTSLLTALNPIGCTTWWTTDWLMDH